MESGTTRTTPRPDGSILRKLAELKERQRWAHHVADAATGKLLTKQLPRPLAPLSRAERLSRLGHHFDPSVFGAPTHRLTPRQPYQASPLGFLRFSWAREVWALGDTNEGHAYWSVAENIVGEDVEGMTAVLFEPPQGRCLLTLQLGTRSMPGQAGRIRIEVVEEGEGTVIGSFGLAAHGDTWNIFDLVFMPGPAPVPTLWVRMTLGPGLDFVGFTSLTLAPAPLRPLVV